MGEFNIYLLLYSVARVRCSEASAYLKTGSRHMLGCTLDESQQQAVALALNHRVALIQGPPGMLKTINNVLFFCGEPRES